MDHSRSHRVTSHLCGGLRSSIIRLGEGGGREVNECQGTGYNLFALAAYFLHARGGARSAFAVGTSGLRFRRLGLLVMVKVGSTGVPWTV